MTLDGAYSLQTPEDAKAFYDRWAEGYDAELSENGYVTPLRCAKALGEHASNPWAPLIEVGCGTGLGGAALTETGFECIDGFDISPDMLARASEKNLYRHLDLLDLSKPIELDAETYQNAAAIGVLNANQMPTTVLDEVLGLLPSGGCFVLSLNDHALANGQFETRLLELTEFNVADLVFKEHGAHLPGIDLTSSVYVLKKR